MKKIQKYEELIEKTRDSNNAIVASTRVSPDTEH